MIIILIMEHEEIITVTNIMTPLPLQVVNRVNSPASYKGKHYIEPNVKRLNDFFLKQVMQANERILK